MRELNPIPTYSCLISALKDKIPNLAYLSVIESEEDKEKENVDWLRDIWKQNGGIFMSNMKHTRESGIKFAERGDMILYGELFISNVSFSLIQTPKIDFNETDFSLTCLFVFNITFLLLLLIKPPITRWGPQRAT